MLEPLVRAALLEDLGRAGDLTTDAIVPAEDGTGGADRAAAGRGGGARLALLAFRLVEPRVEAAVERPDGSRLAPGDVIATLSGRRAAC